MESIHTSVGGIEMVENGTGTFRAIQRIRHCSSNLWHATPNRPAFFQ